MRSPKPSRQAPLANDRSLWQAFRDAQPARRRIVVAAFLVLLAYGLSGGVKAVLYLGALVAIVVLYRLRTAKTDDGLPSDEQLERVDRARAAEDAAEYAASGAGELLYEQVLTELLALVDREVEVMIGTGRWSWRPQALLVGVLRTARNVSESPTSEVLFFAVGDDGNGFYVEREQFVHARALLREGDNSIEVHGADGGVLWIYESAADRQA